ncbi:MAG TPA: TM2 domain-containing protein [Pyrinomonadaceae bacterium]|nr:TM2 domain-containing protein [Pyrinomonadaceae bacterium]
MKSKEKKLTLILLCWLFGVLGAHRFYTGKRRTGMLQLILLIWALSLSLLDTSFPISTLIFLSLFVWVIVDLVRINAGNFAGSEGIVLGIGSEASGASNSLRFQSW